MIHVRLFHLSLVILISILPFKVFADSMPAITDGEKGLQALVEGNQRFSTNHAQHPHQTHQQLVELRKEQHPFAAVLACSDSRITPELIFDQGLGDIFDVRVAGNIADEAVLGSLEYTVDHLHVQIILVMGHQNCGAIEAAMAHEHPHNDVNYIIHSLAPALHHAHGSLEEASKTNVQQVLHRLDHTPTLSKKIATGELKLVGGYYHLDTGQVELLSPVLDSDLKEFP